MENLIFLVEKFYEIISDHLDSFIFMIIFFIIEFVLSGIVFKMNKDKTNIDKINKDKTKKYKTENIYSLFDSEYAQQKIHADLKVTEESEEYLKKIIEYTEAVRQQIKSREMGSAQENLKIIKMQSPLHNKIEKIDLAIDDHEKDKKNADKAHSLDRKKNSIVEDIYIKKMRQYNKASSLIFGGIVLFYAFNVFLAANIKIEVQILLYVLLGFSFISRLLINYRIKKGYYGTNYAEGKEILYYMTADKDRNNINPGKKIFNDIDAYNKVSDQIPEDGELQY